MAQAMDDFVVVDLIEVTGNKKTKDALIFREMELKVKDTLHLSNLTTRFEKNEKLLMNTGLFNSTSINIKDWDEEYGKVILTVEVVESWYIYPLPIFELADRNFNVWWTEFNRSLKRVNYGIRFVYVNFTGNKDDLKVILQGGYTKKILLQYDRPYVNKSKTLGLTWRYIVDHRREFAFNTRGNRLEFFDNLDQINFKSRKLILSTHFRPKVEGFHELLLKYEHNRVTEDILDYNANFFNGKTVQRYFEASYFFTRERRDSRFYPLEGNVMRAEIQKVGLGIFDDINKLSTSYVYAHYFPISTRINFETRIKGQREWTRNNHPYYGLEALGYGEDFVRGYEFYVVDGTDYLISKNSMRFRIFDRVYNLKKLMPAKNYRRFPLSIWVAINADFGKSYNYLYNVDNPLNNRWLFGKGIGLNIIAYYKFALQVEYSFNHLNEKGIFLHVRSDI